MSMSRYLSKIQHELNVVISKMLKSLNYLQIHLCVIVHTLQRKTFSSAAAIFFTVFNMVNNFNNPKIDMH